MSLYPLSASQKDKSLSADGQWQLIRCLTIAGSCGGAGPEVVYLSLCPAREVCASTAGSDIDTVLYVRWRLPR